MKKIILLITSIFTVSFSFAQSVSFGVKGGVNFSTLNVSGGSGYNTSSITGFHAGAFVDLGLNDSWSIQPAVLYTVKGGEGSTSGSVSFGTSTITYSGTGKTKLNYIEVPVNVLYHIPVGIGKIFIGAGPYVAIGISGTDKGTATAGGQTVTTDTKTTFGSGTNDVKNPDFGLNALGGTKLENGLSFSLGYGLGLANLSNDSSGGKIKNGVFSASVGFSFF